MNPETWILRGRRVVTLEGVREATITIQGEKIATIGRHDEAPGAVSVVDVGDLLVLPGLVDTHVHINDPGRADWEGFETATRAAAAGGITTLVDMPLNSDPVTTTTVAFDAKRNAARGRLRVDCGFYGGIVPGNADQIEPLAEAGALGFKAFLCHSGIDEFPDVSEADLRVAMPVLARLGLPLIAHAELVLEGARGMDASNTTSYPAWLASRPDAWEVEAIRLLIWLCRETGCRVHIVHLATAEALPLIADARAGGLPLTVETCPHYLTFAAEEIPDGDPRFKCAPPIRGVANRERLWEGLRDGLIDTIGTDHSPAPPDLKHLDTGDVTRAWGGIASLQLSLPAIWSEARRRGFTPDDLACWMARNPAKLVGLGARKGAIAPGFDADFAVVDPDASFVVDAKSLHHRHPITPYDGRTLVGRVMATYLRGREVARSSFDDVTPLGRPVLRSSEGLDRLNSLNVSRAHAEILRCCGSIRWADRMVSLKPFGTASELLDAADRVWETLEDTDRLEAFAAHPQIGDVDAFRTKFATTSAWASGEQSGVAGASEATLHSLAEGNRAYEARFGFIFIVCASGKTADEMLDLLLARLEHDPEVERSIASAEQAKITRIRLRKLL